ncbi:MAG: reverse transcriptase domain-containing protein [bacterium]|nr:reverse transcriptase domain-containing protein [bacterium]
MKIQLLHKFEDIISVDNLLSAWQEFIRGKRNKYDVQEFSLCLMDNIFNLHEELAHHTYCHGPYQFFNISDPKPRNIHKATMRDRLLHRAIYRILYPLFDKTFMADSYSCRKNKGTHKALDRFRYFAGRASHNHTRTCFVLKCDIKKFFANIDQDILIRILGRHIGDFEILALIKEIISSFHTTKLGIGLPLGNLTSQLLVNIYMHEFDVYMKQELRVKYYLRYADDFVILSDSEEYLKILISRIKFFLEQKLHLNLHENKVYIKTYASGVDFLGWIHFPHYRQLRTSTKRKILRNTRYFPRPQTINSYRGLLSHGNAHKLYARIKECR